MASRIFALIIWAAVAASLAYWGLRWLARPTAVPAIATQVSMEGGAHGDLRRLLVGPPKASEDARKDTSAIAALMSRLKLLGVVAPQGENDPGGVALLSLDGKPAKAVRRGDVIEGETMLLSLTQRSAGFGPQGGPVAGTLDIPQLPPPATGSMPPATGAVMNAQPGMSPVAGQPPMNPQGGGAYPQGVRPPGYPSGQRQRNMPPNGYPSGGQGMPEGDADGPQT
jgi:general secretion pathway protein C